MLVQRIIREKYRCCTRVVRRTGTKYEAIPILTPQQFWRVHIDVQQRCVRATTERSRWSQRVSVPTCTATCDVPFNGIPRAYDMVTICVIISYTRKNIIVEHDYCTIELYFVLW